MIPVYLDNNSTVPILDEALQEMVLMLSSKAPLNPSSTHLLGQKARYLLEEARTSICLSLFGNRSAQYRIIFTSSATEANNQIIKSFQHESIITGINEHPSILEPSKELNHQKIKILSSGLLDINHASNILDTSNNSPCLVSASFCNSETGIIQENLDQIIRKTHSVNALFHSDCSQVLGRCKMQEVFDLDLDYATISSHKIGGPIGIAGLIYKKNKKVPSTMISGGGQEFGLRASTECAIMAHCFALTIKKTIEKYEQQQNKLLKMQQLLESSIKKSGGTIIGEKNKRLVNTSMIFMPGVSSISQVANFDLHQIMISSGSACSSGKHDSNDGLLQMGLPKEVATNCIRVSTFFHNTEMDIVRFCKKWEEIQKTSGAKI